MVQNFQFWNFCWKQKIYKIKFLIFFLWKKYMFGVLQTFFLHRWNIQQNYWQNSFLILLILCKFALYQFNSIQKSLISLLCHICLCQIHLNLTTILMFKKKLFFGSIYILSQSEFEWQIVFNQFGNCGRYRIVNLFPCSLKLEKKVSDALTSFSIVSAQSKKVFRRIWVIWCWDKYGENHITKLLK